MNDHLNICLILINSTAKKEARNNAGQTPLLVAASLGHMKICKLLIDKNANIFAKTGRGYSALHYVAQKGDKNLCEFLVFKALKLLDSHTKIGLTPLHSAALHGHEDICEFLVGKDAQIIKAETDYGDTPLHCAAYMGQKIACEKLLTLGADKNAPNKKGEIPLDFARKNDHVSIINLLSEDDDLSNNSNNNDEKENRDTDIFNGLSVLNHAVLEETQKVEVQNNDLLLLITALEHGDTEQALKLFEAHQWNKDKEVSRIFEAAIKEKNYGFMDLAFSPSSSSKGK